MDGFTLPAIQEVHLPVVFEQALQLAEQPEQVAPVKPAVEYVLPVQDTLQFPEGFALPAIQLVQVPVVLLQAWQLALHFVQVVPL